LPELTEHLCREPQKDNSPGDIKDTDLLWTVGPGGLVRIALVNVHPNVLGLGQLRISPTAFKGDAGLNQGDARNMFTICYRASLKVAQADP
jgi:hypothetical protein